jgi:hypothetical protein
MDGGPTGRFGVTVGAAGPATGRAGATFLDALVLEVRERLVDLGVGAPGV